MDPKTADKVLALSDQIVQENNLTTLMITHNMKDAIAHGNRLIMMDAGRVVVDISGEDKKKLTVPDLLALFSRASALTRPMTKCSCPEILHTSLPGRSLPGILLCKSTVK